MKIALVIERMDPSRGGRETSTAQIANELTNRGHEVTIICRHGSWSSRGVEIRALGTKGLFRVERLRKFTAGATEVISQGSWDIVHAMLPIPGANVYQPRGGTVPAQAAASMRRRSLPGKAISRLVEPLNLCRREMGRLERRVAADESVLCLAVSRMIAEEFRNYYGRTSGVRVVYNGVGIPPEDPDQRADWRQRLRFRLGLSQKDLVFVTVATNFPLKGIAEAIEAFAKWYCSEYRDFDARLVVIGSDMVEGYQRHAGLRQVGSKVVFIPPTEEIFQWYAAADACILLSWYDPCSRVVLEATRWGIPSISTIFNGASEVLAEGAGIVVSSPKDTKAIVAAMDELADPHLRAERSKACMRLAGRISIERHVDELLAAYEDLLAKGRG